MNYKGRKYSELLRYMKKTAEFQTPRDIGHHHRGVRNQGHTAPELTDLAAERSKAAALLARAAVLRKRAKLCMSWCPKECARLEEKAAVLKAQAEQASPFRKKIVSPHPLRCPVTPRFCSPVPVLSLKNDRTLR